MQVHPGNETAGSFGLSSLVDWLQRTPKSELPNFVRGDIGYGTQTWMQELEALGMAYLFKLKQTNDVCHSLSGNVCFLENVGENLYPRLRMHVWRWS